MNYKSQIPDSSDNLAVQIYLEDIARRADLHEGGEGVRSILMNMYRYPDLTSKKLAEKTFINVPAISAVRGELVYDTILKNKANLSDQGAIWVEEALGLVYDVEFLSLLDNTPFDSLKFPSLPFPNLESLESEFEQRPVPDFELDQSRATFNTALKRISLMLKNGDLEGRNILFIGDADATSLFISHLGKVARKLTVLDIDKRVLNYLNRRSCKEGRLPIECIYHDLRNPLPLSLRNQFEVCVTDPPFTEPGARLFLERGLEGIFRQISFNGKSIFFKNRRFYLNYAHKPPYECWKLNHQLLNQGFSIQQYFPRFNYYTGERLVSLFSSLYYLYYLFPEHKLNFQSYSAPIYTHPVQAPLKAAHWYAPVLKKADIIAELIGVPFNFLIDSKYIEKSLVQACYHASLEIKELIMSPITFNCICCIATLDQGLISLQAWSERLTLSLIIIVSNKTTSSSLLSDLKQYFPFQEVVLLDETKKK
ncbi:MAG: bis-aminopropyl spermidine synthase family protein [Candidatus Hermodarchaeota archaeon]